MRSTKKSTTGNAPRVASLCSSLYSPPLIVSSPYGLITVQEVSDSLVPKAKL